MDIKLGEKLRLKSDGMNIWVEEAYTAKNGTECVRNVTGYHGTLEHCLNALVDRRVRASEADTATKLIKEIKSTKKELKTVCGEIRALKGVK